MRKQRYNSFACTAFLWALCFIGLVVIDGTNISYGRTCPDVLIFLVNETESHSNLTLEEQEQSNENNSDNVVEETPGEYSLVVKNNVEEISETSENGLANDDLVLDNSNENGDWIEGENESSWAESNTDKERNSEESYENSTGLVDESLELALDSEDSFPACESILSRALEVDLESWNLERSNTDADLASEYADLTVSFGDSDIVLENSSVSEVEIDSLISELESASADLNKAIIEASEEGNIDNKESDETFENISGNNLSLEDNEVVLAGDDSIEEIESSEQEAVIEEGLKDDASVIIGDENDTIALPKEIETMIDEANALSSENEQSSANGELSLKDNENNDAAFVSSGESGFNDGENLLSGNFLTDELNPDSLEIEEINKEYGWETVESNTNGTRTNSSIGFDPNVSKVQSRQFVGRRPNPKFGDQIDADLTNEFWIVGNNGYDYYFWKYEGNTWRSLSSEEFFSTDDPGRTTIIWAHGYQTDMASATRSGVYLKSLVEKERQTLNQTKPYRLVVWKWDSERNMARIRVDAMNKTALANCSGVSLGKFIGRFNPSDDVCLIGFSFGAQIAGSALQYLATSPNVYMQSSTNEEQSEGVATSGSTNIGKAGRVSLILISAACDSNAFNQGGSYALGAKIPSSVLNVFNPYDSALHYYPFVSNVRAESLGVEAVTGEVFPNTQGKVINFDVSSSVGRKHSFVDEIGSVPVETLSNFFLCD